MRRRQLYPSLDKQNRGTQGERARELLFETGSSERHSSHTP